MTWETVAEKIFKQLRYSAEQNTAIHFIAISHSDQPATDKWVEDIGGPGPVEVLVDPERVIYGAYGLGPSSFWHVLNPWSMNSAFSLGKTDKISVRPTESGSRWQTAGLFAANEKAVIKYSHPAQAADDLGDLNAAISAATEP